MYEGSAVWPPQSCEANCSLERGLRRWAPEHADAIAYVISPHLKVCHRKVLKTGLGTAKGFTPKLSPDLLVPLSLACVAFVAFSSDPCFFWHLLL